VPNILLNLAETEIGIPETGIMIATASVTGNGIESTENEIGDTTTTMIASQATEILAIEGPATCETLERLSTATGKENIGTLEIGTCGIHETYETIAI
jgi:hypothetical protein